MKKVSIKKQESFTMSKNMASRQTSPPDLREKEQSILEMTPSHQTSAEGGSSFEKVGSGEDSYFAAMMSKYDAVKSMEGVGFEGLKPPANLVMTELQTSFASHSVLEEGQRSQFYANKSDINIVSNTSSKTHMSTKYTIPRVKLDKPKLKTNVGTISRTEAKVKDKSIRSRIPRKSTMKWRNTEAKLSTPVSRDSSPSSKSSRSVSLGSGKSQSTASISLLSSPASASKFPVAKQGFNTAKPVQKIGVKTGAQKRRQMRGTSAVALQKPSTLKISREAKKQ